MGQQIYPAKILSPTSAQNNRPLPSKSSSCSNVDKMAPYDSDSSGGEEDEFTETNVLLGYASADANGEEISRLGGRPVCLAPSSTASNYSRNIEYC